MTADRLLNADDEPGNWLMYSGQYSGQRFSRLDQIHRGNVDQLRVKWIHQLGTQTEAESTPIVVGGVVYVTSSPNNVTALDARTGGVFWKYEPPRPPLINACCGEHNRGVAILGETLFLGTLDAKLVALDAKSGQVIWTTTVGTPEEGHSITSAPLVVEDKVLIGVAGGEYGIRGYLDAYDAETGERVWRQYTIPGPGEPGHDTWEGESWKIGGAPAWLTGTYDPDLRLTYWGVGNPGPDYYGADREGDNLYSDCVIALDVDTGEIEWHFQFTPHDVHDWDATEIPVLVDREWNGEMRKLMLFANRNAFFYVLDRTNGDYLQATPYAMQTWAERIDGNGRPVVLPNTDPTEEGNQVAPPLVGATNWWSPSYSPRTGLFYVRALDAAGLYYTFEPEFRLGEFFVGGGMEAVGPDDSTVTELRALDPMDGSKRWGYPLQTPADEPGSQYESQAGILSTAGDLVFNGTREGFFFALDATDGEPLWNVNLGGTILAAPISYMVDGNQYVMIAAGHALVCLGLETPVR